MDFALSSAICQPAQTLYGQNDGKEPFHCLLRKMFIFVAILRQQSSMWHKWQANTHILQIVVSKWQQK